MLLQQQIQTMTRFTCTQCKKRRNGEPLFTLDDEIWCSHCADEFIEWVYNYKLNKKEDNGP